MSMRKKILDQLFFGRDPLKDFPAHRFPTDLQGWHSQHPYLTRAIAEVKPAVVVTVADVGAEGLPTGIADVSAPADVATLDTADTRNQ